MIKQGVYNPLFEGWIFIPIY